MPTPAPLQDGLDVNVFVIHRHAFDRTVRGLNTLHIREDPVPNELAGGGVYRHLIKGAPGRIRTCAHGSGGR
ncbi:hypothetical protein GCM10018785_25120 [Streptomyces longispororuber]|uniref:Uncharacterized protein n=1 Tax=Streptomyces longispororuber TaxID=68230 RepID=A0A918ZIA4_9ACTN|nr:hypothetical protein GCM10018785_25120 [Streptomyces longispororuber]